MVHFTLVENGSVAVVLKRIVSLPSASQHLASTAGAGLRSTSQHLSSTAGIGVASSAYIAPNGLPAPQVYFYGGNNPYVPETDGYQHSAFVNDIGYHLPVFQHQVSPLFYPSIDGGYPPQTFYSPGWTSIPAFNTDNIFYGHQFQHPGSIYQQVPYPESQYWPFPSEVPPTEAIMPVLEDLGIHGSYVNSIQFGNNNFFGSRPGFNSASEWFLCQRLYAYCFKQFCSGGCCHSL